MARLFLDMGGAVDAINSLRGVQKRIQGPKSPQLKKIADRFAERIRKRIQAGVAPPPSATTLKMRKGSGGGGSLLDTGELLANVKAFSGESVAAAGVDKFYASFVQFGFTTGERSAIPGKKVPARPFVLIDPADADWALQLLRDQILGDDTTPLAEAA